MNVAHVFFSTDMFSSAFSSETFRSKMLTRHALAHLCHGKLQLNKINRPIGEITTTVLVVLRISRVKAILLLNLSIADNPSVSDHVVC